MVLRNWADMIVPGSLWVHYIDNDSALATLVKGSSSVMSGECITAFTHSKIADLGLWTWFDRVASDDNPVDKLSVSWVHGRPMGVEAHRVPAGVVGKFACLYLLICILLVLIYMGLHGQFSRAHPVAAPRFRRAVLVAVVEFSLIVLLVMFPLYGFLVTVLLVTFLFVGFVVLVLLIVVVLVFLFAGSSFSNFN